MRRAARCVRGHAWTPETTGTTPKGHRRCLACAEARRSARLAAAAAPRPCAACRRTLPPRLFGNGSKYGGTDTPRKRKTCLDCEAKARRAAGVPARHKRRNARGDVWCNACRHYLTPAAFKRHPSRPHTFWAYCRACTREIDRARGRAKRRTAEGQEEQRRAVARKARRRRAEQLERARFVAEAIALLLRRGFTKADICRLADVSWGSLLAWERAERRVTPAVAERFAILLRATSHVATGPEPCPRRRRPHPELPMLIERVAPLVAAHPVRSRWKGGAPSSP